MSGEWDRKTIGERLEYYSNYEKMKGGASTLVTARVIII